MTNKKKWIRLSCLTAAILIPAIGLLILFASLPLAYSETFVGELADKYERLNEIKEPKIVIIGGSSVAFGINSGTLEQVTGYKVVNFGLYATLGTKIMLDLSEKSIKNGDIVILAPELDKQTLSMYFNSTTAWQALEGNPKMLCRIGSSNIGQLLAKLPDYLAKRYEAAKSGSPISPSGVYRHDSFNEFGDISYPRAYNVMTFQYDKTQTITLNSSIFDSEFVDYLNDYINRIKHKGAQVYFSYCPMNKAALAAETTPESIKEFNSFIAQTLNCEIITDPNNSIMDMGYFYDTNYHLNDAGVTVHTAYLAADIMRTLGKTDFIIGELPSPPGKEPTEDDNPGSADTEDPYEKYFVGEDFGGAIRITGTTDAARFQSKLEIPKTIGGKPVQVIGSEVFKNCEALTEIVVRENITLIEDGAFRGCATLLSLSIMHENADKLECGKQLFDGAPDVMKILLYTDQAYSNFSAGYWWGAHAARMIKVNS